MADLSSNRSELAPAFQCYAADVLADAAGMTHEEFGMYWRLVLHAWRDRGLPTDRARLALFVGLTPARLRRAWPVIGAPFTEQDGRLVLPWMERQRERQAERRGKQQQAAESKWGTPPQTERDKRSRSERLAAARALGRHTPGEWETMLAAYGNRCLRCSATSAESQIVKDHVIPIYQGGSDAITNLQPLCSTCNASKGRERKDHRVGRPETRPEWLPNACETPPRAGVVEASDASSAVAASVAMTTTAANARERFPRVAAALDAEDPELLEHLLSRVAGAETIFLGKCEKALGGIGEPASHRLTPEQLGRAVGHYVANLATGDERSVNSSRFDAYLGRALKRANEPPRDRTAPARTATPDIATRTFHAGREALKAREEARSR